MPAPSRVCVVLVLLGLGGCSPPATARSEQPSASTLVYPIPDSLRARLPRGPVTVTTTLIGLALDAHTGAPIEGATIRVSPLAAGANPAVAELRSAQTDASGRFVLLSAGTGRVQIAVQRIQYASYRTTRDFRPDLVDTLVVRLVPVPGTLVR